MKQRQTLYALLTRFRSERASDLVKMVEEIQNGRGVGEGHRVGVSASILSLAPLKVKCKKIKHVEIFLVGRMRICFTPHTVQCFFFQSLSVFPTKPNTSGSVVEVMHD